VNILTDLNRRFDHALLMPEVDEKAVVRLCDEARQWNFHSVAINPVWVPTAGTALQGSSVKVLAAVGFPLGANRTDIKLAEAVKSVADGAHEIDMVANIGWLASGEMSKAESEIRRIREALPFNIVLKVIIEAGKLTDEQQVTATKAVINGGAQFVKTCTGFFGVTDVDQVRRLFRAAAGQIEVKASGGIRTVEHCRHLLEAGATRLGSSSSVSIMQEFHSISRP
jgi:deoxyribose-phosphate aldolase